MQKKFYYKLDFIKLLIIISILLVSCKSPLRFIKNKDFIFNNNIELIDKKILASLDDYIIYNNIHKKDDKGVYIIFSKENLYNQNVKEYYISNTFNLSKIFEHPCTGYFKYKNEIVLVYSKEIGYINPVNYPKSFINNIKKRLYDDWTLKKINCHEDNYLIDGTIVSNHSNINFIKNNQKRIINYNEINFSKVCYNKDNFDYTYFINLDNFRTVNLEDCNEW